MCTGVRKWDFDFSRDVPPVQLSPVYCSVNTPNPKNYLYLAMTPSPVYVTHNYCQHVLLSDYSCGSHMQHGQSSKNTHLQLEPISIFFDTQEADLDSSPVVRKFRITPPRVIGQEDDVTHHPWQRLFSMESFIARRFEDTTVVVIATSQCMILKVSGSLFSFYYHLFFL